MNPTKDFGDLATQEQIDATVKALQEHGFDVSVVENGDEAKLKTLELIPEGSEVMTASSTTNNTIGLTEELNESGKYDSIKTKFSKMDRETQGNEMRKLGAGPDYIVGSAHAVTMDGKAVIASATGSQLPGYAYGAENVIWIVSTKKIVTNLEEAFDRIEKHVFPLEDERAMKAYGSGSGINKMLIVNKEVRPGRIHIIFVKEDLGF